MQRNHQQKFGQQSIENLYLKTYWCDQGRVDTINQMVASRRDACPKNGSKECVGVDSRARRKELKSIWEIVELWVTGNWFEKNGNCGYCSWASSFKACRSCRLPLAISVSRFASRTAVRKSVCCVEVMVGVSGLCLFACELQTHTMCLFTSTCFLLVFSLLPTHPMSSNFNFPMIEPTLSQYNWPFPVNGNQPLISGSTGSSPVSPQVHVPDHLVANVWYERHT